MTKHNEKFGEWRDTSPLGTFANTPLPGVSDEERAAVYQAIIRRGLEETTVADMLGVRPDAPAEKDQEREPEKKTIKRPPVRRASHTPSEDLVDAAPVREHLLHLVDSGMTIAGIAREAGVSNAWAYTIKAGQARTSKVFADRVLALNPLTEYRFCGNREEAADECRRMLRELHLRGYGIVKLADHIGASPSWVDGVARGTVSRTLPGKVAKVRASYLILKHADGGNSRARNRAKKFGWDIGDAA